MAAVYAAAFALLGVDTAVRVWLVRAAFDSAFDVGFLLVYEGMRVLTIGLAVVLGAGLLARGRDRATVSLAALVLLLAVAYGKATAYSGFPGIVQERLARTLLGAGVPAGPLDFIFGQPLWTLGFAAAAFLRLAVTYPASATADAVLAAGARDRKGLLGGRGIAGADVGDLARRAAARALDSGLLRPLPVWTAATTLAFAQGMGSAGVAGAASGVAIGLPLLFGIPSLRAGLAAASRTERARILWFCEAALVAALAVVVAGIPSALPGEALGWLSFLALAIAPMVVLLCLVTAIAPTGGVAPERALLVTVHWGATAVAAVAVAAAVEAALAAVLPADGVRAGVALVAAALTALPVHAVVRTRGSRARWWGLTPAATDR